MLDTVENMQQLGVSHRFQKQLPCNRHRRGVFRPDTTLIGAAHRSLHANKSLVDEKSGISESTGAMTSSSGVQGIFRDFISNSQKPITSVSVTAVRNPFEGWISR